MEWPRGYACNSITNLRQMTQPLSAYVVGFKQPARWKSWCIWYSWYVYNKYDRWITGATEIKLIMALGRPLGSTGMPKMTNCLMGWTKIWVVHVQHMLNFQFFKIKNLIFWWGLGPPVPLPIGCTTDSSIIYCIIIVVVVHMCHRNGRIFSNIG